MPYAVTFCPDAATFLSVAGDLLAARPVEATVVATVAGRQASEPAGAIDPGRQPYNWFAAVTDERGAVVGAAMRTAGFAPYPAFLLPMPDDAARALVTALHERGERLDAANGALPAVEAAMAEAARRAGARVVVAEETRLWELAELREPPVVPGRLRPAAVSEAELLAPWLQGFGAESAAMSGRAAPHGTTDFTPAEVARRIEQGTVWVWEVDGEVVHVTAASLPAFGVARIGPVLTPREHRGHGYASATVAAVAASLRGDGARVCLFTDRANPTSNRIYAAIGFEPVTEMVHLELA
ncbi:MAG TPA: GNAT family N-acetyltransferase [Nocardioides sp.]|uniref:GNAT family N-acetyltransferase n=1 Tax=Nocardioides sp. TaxID=35761 RepID=UPI002ED7D1E7